MRHITHSPYDCVTPKAEWQGLVCVCGGGGGGAAHFWSRPTAPKGCYKHKAPFWQKNISSSGLFFRTATVTVPFQKPFAVLKVPFSSSAPCPFFSLEETLYEVFGQSSHPL